MGSRRIRIYPDTKENIVTLAEQAGMKTKSITGIETGIKWVNDIYLNGKKKAFSILPVKTSACNYDEDALICRALTKSKISIQANGDIIPCAPMAGFLTLHNVKLGNVKRDGLQKLLTEGPLIENIWHTIGEKRIYSQECRNCRYFENCQGGCPALSLLFRGNIMEPDATKCAFFTGDYYNSFCKALEGWENLTPLQ